RRRFARTSRTSYQQDAIWQADQPLEGLLVVREEAQFRQAQPQTFFIQNTHDDALAVIGRQAGHTQIDGFAANRSLNTSVLRNPLFGNRHVGLNLQTTDDRSLQTLWRAFHLVQHAI